MAEDNDEQSRQDKVSLYGVSMKMNEDNEDKDEAQRTQ